MICSKRRDRRSAGGTENEWQMRARAHTQRCLLAASRLGSLPSLPFLSLTAMFPPQTSFFSVRYAGAKANLLRARMRSIPTAALLLRVPSVAANARLSGQHASIRFLTIGTTVSIGLLGIVRVYISYSLSVCFGPSLWASLSCMDEELWV